MTTKKTELHDGDEWVDVTGHVAGDVTIRRGRSNETEPGAVSLMLDNSDGVPEPEPLSLHGFTAAEALDALRGARAALAGRVVLVDAPVGAPRDSVVVEAHHFAGEHVGKAWHFHPVSLDMACRLAGWRKVERLEPGKVRLS